MAYAIFESGSKQYRVSPGDEVEVELLGKKEGAAVAFDRVLLVADGTEVQVGQPYVQGIRVAAKVVANGKDPKVVIFKYHNKTNYRRKIGHRQPFTRVKIEEIK